MTRTYLDRWDLAETWRSADDCGCSELGGLRTDERALCLEAAWPRLEEPTVADKGVGAMMRLSLPPWTRAVVLVRAPWVSKGPSGVDVERWVSSLRRVLE